MGPWGARDNLEASYSSVPRAFGSPGQLRGPGGAGYQGRRKVPDAGSAFGTSWKWRLLRLGAPLKQFGGSFKGVMGAPLKGLWGVM